MLTPVIPSPTGGGSPMRAAATLECLSRLGRVVVVHVECWGETPDVADRSWCRGKAAAVVVIQPNRIRDLPGIIEDTLTSASLGPRIDVVYAFRFVLASTAHTCRDLFHARMALLDLDDDEAHLDEFLIAFRRDNGDGDHEALLRAQAHRRRVTRAMLVPRFNRVYLANPGDVDVIAAHHPGTCVQVLPNVAPSPPTLHRIDQDPARMLFIGTLGYLPNEDGVGWFIRDVLPSIRQIDARLYLRVAGVGAPGRLASLLRGEGVDFAGAVPDVAPEYAAAGMMVVPLRAGSGTRIKILEAFHHGTPVVSTSVGAAGLAVTNGDQLYLADSAADIAACCLRLAGDARERRRLSARAGTWVSAHHSLNEMHRTLAHAFDELGARP